MPSFVHPALLWGLPVVAVPLLIHLINLLRRRRVRWAAMEFLLRSQKKNRTRIALKQLLLLLMRMAAIAILVAMLAQPLLQNRWSRLFGGGQTHHVVLLDDSFSMSDRWGDTSAMDEAKAVIGRIGLSAAGQPQSQTFTLLRFSRSARTSRLTEPDLLQQPVDHRFADLLAGVLDPIVAGHTAVGPDVALECLDELLGETEGEHRIIYLVSDFRARQWDEPDDLRSRLRRLDLAGAKLQLINCVDQARPNLSIASLRPGQGTPAVDVPLSMEVAVTNHGAIAAKNVPVLLEADGRAIPAVRLPEIPPGKTVQERFSVRFSTPGEHRVTARLENDGVMVDNSRFHLIEFPAELPVLLIDGGMQAIDAQYLQAALDPGGPAVTGLSPRIEKPRFLSLNPLEPFRAIYLLNVARLDESAVRALEAYLTAGGGVGMFLGPQTQPSFVNQQLYRDGQGFFPLPLTGQEVLLVDRLQRAPDVDVSNHPIFRILAGKRNSFLSMLVVDRYLGVPTPWPDEVHPTTRVIATLRNGDPFALERRFGEGRVVVFLSTASPEWNNWARSNPSYVVAMLETQAFLSRRPEEKSRLVGAPLELELDAAAYLPEVRFFTPEADAQGGPPMIVNAVPSSHGLLTARLGGADTAGIYQVELTRQDGSRESRRWAFNVVAEEGDLTTLGASQLAARLEGVSYQYEDAASFQYLADDLAGFNLKEPLLFFLLLWLILEQLLAWSASYHASPVRQVETKGGVR